MLGNRLTPRAPAASASAALSLGVLLGVHAALAATPQVPATPKRPVETTYQGVKITEDYRWLEDSAAPEVKAWSDAQNAVTRQFLDSFPSRGAILERVDALTQSISPLYYDLRQRGKHVFALKDAPPRQQPLLVVMSSIRDTSDERVVVDPNLLDPSGETAIDFYVPSLDGSRVAVSMSKGGSEAARSRCSRWPPASASTRCRASTAARRRGLAWNRRHRVLAHLLSGAGRARHRRPAFYQQSTFTSWHTESPTGT
jgi:protease II